MTVLIVIPVLRRPHRVVPLLESIDRATPEDHRVLFICSPEDRPEIAAIEAAQADYLVTPHERCDGDYARKINYAYRCSTEPWLFLAADDLHFHPGWLTKAFAWTSPSTGVVGTNDLTNRRTRRVHSTHSLVARKYIDRYGTIDQPQKVLHDRYMHNFVDDELIGTAQHRGAYVHADDCLVEHLHPMGQKAERDPVYDLGQAGFDHDRRLFQRRQPLWT